MSPPTYLHRLRLEGAVLAGCGALGTVGLLLASTPARHGPASTAGQLAVVAILLAWLGPRGVRRSIARSRSREPEAIGSGEPTPLWHIVAIVAGLTVVAGGLAGWDAGVRVTGGCVLVGAVQGLLIAPLVGREQRRTGRTYYRIPGSRILKGTLLGHVGGDGTGAVAITEVRRPGARASGPA
ncbi:MAG: hypothetical protein ACR2NR_17420 [Solirubrobacteraceae bacterium]